MFGWFSKKKVHPHVEKLEHETKQSFHAVKKDMESVGKWVKHLDERDKQLSEKISELKEEISSIRGDIYSLHEAIEETEQTDVDEQLFEKKAVGNKQTADLDVQEVVGTGVQTGNIYDILKRLSGNERLIVYTMLNSDMKLSYEDLALLLGKDRSTIRGQVNAIKQKSGGIVEEIIEKSGKKRVYIPDEIREKLQKYAKVRTGKEKKK